MQKINKIVFRLKRWNRWRKLSSNKKSVVDEVLVLFNIKQAPSFDFFLSWTYPKEDYRSIGFGSVFHIFIAGLAVFTISVSTFMTITHTEAFYEDKLGSEASFKPVSEVLQEETTINQLVVEMPSDVILEPVSDVKEEVANTLLPIEEALRQACMTYDVPFDIVLAIARLETGWFKSDAYVYRNNPGGMSVNEMPLHYNTIEEGVDAMVSNLAHNYFGIGLNTPELIGQKYCPINPSWPGMIREMMSYGY